MKVPDWNSSHQLDEKFYSECEYDPEKCLDIMEEIIELAVMMGALPPDDPLHEIEIDIKYAKAINGIKDITDKTR